MEARTAARFSMVLGVLTFVVVLGGRMLTTGWADLVWVVGACLLATESVRLRRVARRELVHRHMENEPVWNGQPVVAARWGKNDRR